MADDPVFFKEIVENDPKTELFQFKKIDDNRLGALSAVPSGDVGRHGLAIRDNPIDQPVRDVPLDGSKMIGLGVAGRFTGLGHEVGDVHARRSRARDGLGNLRDEQIRKDAGIERARAQENKVGELYRRDGLSERTHMARRQGELLDGSTAGGDARFAMDHAAVGERGNEVDVRKRGRKDAAANGEDFAADAHRFREIPGNVRERGQKEIPEIVADQAASRLKAILKKAAEKRFVFRKRDHAIADVAGRQNSILTSKTTGASTVVSNRNNGGKIDDGTLGSGMAFMTAEDVFLESSQKSREAGATAKRDNAETGNAATRFCDLSPSVSTWSSEKLILRLYRKTLEQCIRCGMENPRDGEEISVHCRGCGSFVGRFHSTDAAIRVVQDKAGRSAAEAVFFRVQQFGKAGVFLEEGEVFIIARVVTVFGAELDGNLEIGHGGIGFASEAIERRERVMNVVGFRRGLAGFQKAFAGFVPAANIHHGHATLVVLLSGPGIFFLKWLHALLGDFHVHAGAVGKLLAGPLKNLLELLLGAGEFLLMKKSQGLVIDFELRLDEGIDELDAPPLDRVWRC